MRRQKWVIGILGGIREEQQGGHQDRCGDHNLYARLMIDLALTRQFWRVTPSSTQPLSITQPVISEFLIVTPSRMTESLTVELSITTFSPVKGATRETREHWLEEIGGLGQRVG